MWRGGGRHSDAEGGRDVRGKGLSELKYVGMVYVTGGSLETVNNQKVELMDDRTKKMKSLSASRDKDEQR
jgi:hypothetical protein